MNPKLSQATTAVLFALAQGGWLLESVNPLDDCEREEGAGLRLTRGHEILNVDAYYRDETPPPPADDAPRGHYA